MAKNKKQASLDYEQKVDQSIKLIQAWMGKEKLYLGFSGGADSVVLKHITTIAVGRENFDAVYCVSPIDPRIIHQFIKSEHPDVIWEYHARGFWRMVDKKGLPFRQRRWCCEVIKEAGGEGRIVLVGNRRDESPKRKAQCFVEHARGNKNKLLIRPILDFTDNDRWRYIRENKLAYIPLYDEGAKRLGYGEGIFKRLGCVLCPFERQIAREEEYFPEIIKLWRLACDRIITATKARGYKNLKGEEVKHKFETGEELYQWWTRRD